MTSPDMASAEVGHTPGPWRIQGDDIPECWIIENEEGDFIAQCEDSRGFATLDCVANTAFIVRACNAHYDLLEALEAMVLNDRHTYRDCHKRACAAIAKATGAA